MENKPQNQDEGKKPIPVKPSIYAFYFDSLKACANHHGYNLLINGSLNRDCDIVAVPWINKPDDDFPMIQEFDKILNGTFSQQKEHYRFDIGPAGRYRYIIDINRSGPHNNYTDQQYYLDISVIPFLWESGEQIQDLKELKQAIIDSGIMSYFSAEDTQITFRERVKKL